VLKSLAGTKWVMGTAVSPDVGMAGFVQGGGMGYGARKYGLAIDNVKSFTVVLASGNVVIADERSNSDLFWALRGGGGGNFGVVVEMVLQAHPGQDKQLFGLGVIPIDYIGEFFALVSENKNKIPAELLLYLEGGMGDLSMTVYFAWIGENDASLVQGRKFVETYLKPVLFNTQSASVQYNEQSIHNYTAAQDPGENYYISGFSGFLSVANSTRENWKLIGDRLAQLVRTEQYTLLDIELWGGAISKQSASATAFLYRDALFQVGFIEAVPRTADYAMKRFRQATATGSLAYDDIKGLFHGAYVNYQMSTLGEEDALDLYYGRNLERLEAVKRRYDPTNRFRYEQSIPVPT